MNTTQKLILDRYYANPETNNFKAIARDIGISNEEIRGHVSRINNLTGLLPQKKVACSGISSNPLIASDVCKSIEMLT